MVEQMLNDKAEKCFTENQQSTKNTVRRCFLRLLRSLRWQYLGGRFLGVKLELKTKGQKREVKSTKYFFRSKVEVKSQKMLFE